MAFDRISVIIPAYNAEDVLTRSLDSASQQTVPPHEIIVVDDGSTDATARVAQSYPGVRYIRQANAGVSAARNTGIRAATGTWVAILDADDDWTPGKNERQLAILARHPECVWCGCNSSMVYPDGRRVVIMPPALKPDHLNGEVLPYFESVLAGAPFATSGMLFKRDVFDRAGWFDERLRVAEERDLFWRVACEFPTLAFDRAVSVGYYVGTPNSLTKGSMDRSQSLQMICDNLRRSRAAGSTGAAALQYGRGLAIYNYLTRHAAGEISLAPAVVADATALLRPTMGERLLLTGLRTLPAAVASRLARLFLPRFH